MTSKGVAGPEVVPLQPCRPQCRGVTPTFVDKMITTQTIRAVLSQENLIRIELHENGPASIVVWMAYEPSARGVLPLLQQMPIVMPNGQSGLTASQALQQAWSTAQAVANRHNDVVVGLEIDSYALLLEPQVVAITGALPITRI